MDPDLSRDLWDWVFIPHLLRHSVPLLRRIQLVYSQPRFSNIARHKEARKQPFRADALGRVLGTS